MAKDPSGGEPYTDILRGYTFCASGGYMLGPSGVSDSVVSRDPYGKYVLGYDETCSIGLHNRAADTYDGGAGRKERKIPISPLCGFGIRTRRCPLTMNWCFPPE